MRLERVEDLDMLRAHLRRDEGHRLYELGDLDPEFFPSCAYVGGFQGEELVTVFLCFLPADPTVCLFMGSGDADLEGLAQAHATLLESRCYFHLSPRLAAWLGERGVLSNQRPHDRMLLRGDAWRTSDAAGSARLVTDPAKLLELYEASYPGHTFVAQEMRRARFMGWFDPSGELVAAAGTHVMSRSESVAALGNIATRPEHRGRGYGGAVTAALVRSLHGDGIETIGLNVLCENAAALGCYTRLGFERVTTFVEADYERSGDVEDFDGGR